MTRQWLVVDGRSMVLEPERLPVILSGRRGGGMGGHPPSEGRKGRWDGSGGYIERATCREVNKHGD